MLLSGGQPYVHPIEKLDPFGVSIGNLIGSVSYSFVHIGLKHLIGNLAVLFLVGAVLEQRIGSGHVLAIYVLAGTFAGLAFAALFPGTWVVGASAAVTGIITAAYVVDIKKACIALVAGMFLVAMVLFPLTDFALNALESQKAGNIAEYSQDIAGIGMALGEIQEKIDAGTATGEDIARQRQYLEESGAFQQKAEGEALEKTGIEEGRRTEATTPVSVHIHVLGILFTLAYLAVLKPKAFQMLRNDVGALKASVKW